MMEYKILITDDDASIRRTLSVILDKQGYFTKTALNGRETLKEIKVRDYNVVVLDYELPDINGLNLTRKIKEEDKDIEVVILTGKATMDSAIEAVKEDIFDYLLKPVNPDKLIAVLNSALEKQNLRRERKELIWELKKKNKELEKMSKFKSGLISMLSHDLRSPLSSLRGYNESFLQGFLGEIRPKQKEVFKIENEIIGSMVNLIDNLLDMEQIGAGKLNMKKRPASIFNDVIKPVIKRIDILAKEKNIHIECNVKKDIPDIKMDSDRIMQVFQNIFQNALKFTPKGGNISVSVKRCEVGVEVSVKDSGPGIEQNQLDKIFKAFYSLGHEGSFGRGLGLSIAREIVKAHDGMIWAESKESKNGSKFVFILPETCE